MVASAQPWQSKDSVTVLVADGCAYTVIVFTNSKGSQEVAVKVHGSIGSPWARAALCLNSRGVREREREKARYVCKRGRRGRNFYTVVTQAMTPAASERYFIFVFGGRSD